MPPYRSLLIGAGLLTGFGTTLVVTMANDDALPPPNHNFPHKGFASSLDHAAIRRGHQVYKQVCSSCHSMDRVHYRNLVGVAYTEEEAKAIAAEELFVDGPDDSGQMFERPGILTDPFKPPYLNEKEARASNNGALPPDLSLMVKARHGGEDYVYALLTGYEDDPPEDHPIPDDMNYNPYFAGGAIAMAPPLFDDAAEYDDGTEATVEQMAHDVATFLKWTAEPEHDERKLLGIKVMVVLGAMVGLSMYAKRMRWAGLKSRVVRIVKDQ